MRSLIRRKKSGKRRKRQEEKVGMGEGNDDDITLKVGDERKIICRKHIPLGWSKAGSKLSVCLLKIEE